MKERLYFHYLDEDNVIDRLSDQLCGMCQLARRNPASDIGESYCPCGFDWTDEHCLYASTADYYVHLLHDYEKRITCILGGGAGDD